MDKKKLIESLHPLERKVINSLKKYKKLDYIIKDSGLKEVEVTRALQWLNNKSFLSIHKEEKELIGLDKNGEEYLKKGLPEKRMLEEISKEPKAINDIKSLAKEEIGISLGELKKKAAINIIDGKIQITTQGEKLLEKESLEEIFLKKDFPLEKTKLKEEEIFALNNLLKRKNILKIDVKKEVEIELSTIGKEIIEEGISDEKIIERLTPELIKSGEWKNKKFRRYDVSINVPQITGGKKHFVKQALEHAKQIWIDLGFKEMKTTMVQTSFWNFDALFTPQDHPVREMQDTFFIKTVKDGNLPEKDIVKRIKQTHEEGVDGSTGWKNQWDERTAKQNVLRTHTTCASAKTLYNLKENDLPAKFFALGRCFRNETLDWSHLFEFNQTEGIVVDQKANFCHLLGYLKQFFKKMGFDNVRFRPAYFPYTEPSVEIDVFHPVHKTWLELGGAGIFRPEVTIPLLGKDIPVLAWGPGFDRIIMDFYKINDMRELYNNDLKDLRTKKAWI